MVINDHKGSNTGKKTAGWPKNDPLTWHTIFLSLRSALTCIKTNVRAPVSLLTFAWNCGPETASSLINGFSIITSFLLYVHSKNMMISETIPNEPGACSISWWDSGIEYCYRTGNNFHCRHICCERNLEFKNKLKSWEVT